MRLMPVLYLVVSARRLETGVEVFLTEKPAHWPHNWTIEVSEARKLTTLTAITAMAAAVECADAAQIHGVRLLAVVGS